jgi:hypothetical protein
VVWNGLAAGDSIGALRAALLRSLQTFEGAMSQSGGQRPQGLPDAWR